MTAANLASGGLIKPAFAHRWSGHNRGDCFHS
jgi:hypothetical protein